MNTAEEQKKYLKILKEQMDKGLQVIFEKFNDIIDENEKLHKSLNNATESINNITERLKKINSKKEGGML